jgi:hypothetical protein
MGGNGLGTEPPLTSELAFERRWSVRVPAGVRVNVVAGILALALGVAAAVALALSIAATGAATGTATFSGAPRTIDGVRLLLVVGVALGAVGAAATWRLWRVVGRDGRWVPSTPILPAVVEYDGGLVIEKYSGRCPECGTKLRFYNRPVRWHDEPDEAGRRPVIDERRPAAECRSDLRHWWTIDGRAPAAPAKGS